MARRKKKSDMGGLLLLAGLGVGVWFLFGQGASSSSTATAAGLGGPAYMTPSWRRWRRHRWQASTIAPDGSIMQVTPPGQQGGPMIGPGGTIMQVNPPGGPSYGGVASIDPSTGNVIMADPEQVFGETYTD